MNGRITTKLMFPGDIDGVACSENELVYLSGNIYIATSTFGMEINPTKTKMMINDNNCRVSPSRMNKLKPSTTSNI